MYSLLLLLSLCLFGVLAYIPKKRDLVALTCIGREQWPFAKLVIRSFLDTKDLCPSDENIDLLIVTDEMEVRPSFRKYVTTYVLPQDIMKKREIAFMAKLEIVTWPFIDAYDRVIQIDSDVLINTCLSTIFDKMDDGATIYAHPSIYNNSEAWSLVDYPNVTNPFDSGIMAYHLNEFMIEHITVLSDWIQEQLALGVPHYTDQSFVNVYASQHNIINTTGALTDETVLVNPPHQLPEQRMAYDQPLLHFVTDKHDAENTKNKYRQMHRHLDV